jgi:antitoxin VapB
MLQITKAFWLGGSQAVRLPPEFWFEGDEVRIERRGANIVLSPIRGQSLRQVVPARPEPANDAQADERGDVSTSLGQFQATAHALAA